MIYKKTITYIIFILLLVSCSVVPTKSGVETVTPESTLFQTTSQQSPTHTPNIPSQEPVILITDTPAPTGIQNCQNMGVPVTSDGVLSIEGAIIFEDRSTGTFNLLGGNPSKITPMAIEGLVDRVWRNSLYDVSPDGEWLVYMPDIPNDDIEGLPNTFEIKLQSNDGKEVTQTIHTESISQYLPEDTFLAYLVSVKWINASNMLLQFHYIFDNHSLSFTGQPTNSLIDPFTGEWKNDILDGLSGYSSDHGSPIAFSPDMTRVVYYSAEQQTLILSDLVNGDVLWKKWGLVENPDLFYMSWSTNSQWVTLSNKSNSTHSAILLSREGLEKIIELPTGRLRRDISWASDSQVFVVGWQVTDNRDQTVNELLVYNINKDSVIYECPLQNQEGHTKFIFFWSPTENRIAYTQIKYSPLVIINLEDGSVIQYADEAILFGWSGKFNP